MSLLVGVQSGLCIGMHAGVDAGCLEIDALSGIVAPANASQWASIGITPATDTWRCQEPSGNLVSDAGTVLTANASPLYQQPVANWDRRAVGFNATLNQRFLHATYNNMATSSLLALMYIIVGATPATLGGMFVAGTNTSGAGLSVTTTPAIRYRNGATIRDSAGTYQTDVVPIFFQHDVTNSAARFLTTDEKIEPAFGAVAGTIFGLGTGTSANFSCLLLAAWRGAAAEQSLATLHTWLTRLRWTPSWTP